MANGHGGYRRPENPAPVSGPGKMSKRTDGFGQPKPAQTPKKVTGLPYGENKQVNETAAAAPMSAAPNPLSMLPPINAPTAYPDEPITSGVPVGPGPNSTTSFHQQEEDYVAAAIRSAYASMPSPQLRALVNQLEIEGR